MGDAGSRRLICSCPYRGQAFKPKQHGRHKDEPSKARASHLLRCALMNLEREGETKAGMAIVCPAGERSLIGPLSVALRGPTLG